jgi:hypothetical protein
LLKPSTIPADLLFVLNTFFDKKRHSYTSPIAEEESQEYAACTFMLNDLFCKFRTAKITPTKTGQFVTLWKRNKEGVTEPHDASDPIDLFIIHTRKHHRFGLFVFPKSMLMEKGIVSDKNKSGKRGFRVYPSWDRTESKQAKASQQWQLNYFVEIEEINTVTLDRMGKLCTI